MSDTIPIRLTVNGDMREGAAEPRKTLADFLREDLDLTGTHLGCEHGVCGACTVLLDGEPVRSCLMLAVQARDASITTIEGLAAGGDMNALQEALRDEHSFQCGFCTPGFVMQKPHWNEWLSRSADCSAFRSSPAAKPSIVVMLAPGPAPPASGTSAPATIEEDHARATHAVLAAEMGAGQVEVFAEEVGERLAGLGHALATGVAVHRRLDSPPPPQTRDMVSLGARAPPLVQPPRFSARSYEDCGHRPSIRRAGCRSEREGTRSHMAASRPHRAVGAPSLIPASASAARTGRSATLMSATRTSPARHRRGHRHHREVAVAPGHLLHRDAGAGRACGNRMPVSTSSGSSAVVK